MKIKVLIAAFLLCLCLTAQATAQSMYVIDKLSVNLRTGAGNEFRIIKLLPSGTRLELVEKGERWSRVTTVTGEEGWIPSQWINSNPTSAILLKRITVAHDELKQKTDDLLEKVETLTDENQRLSASLSNAQSSFSEAETSYNKLKEKSANFLQLEEDYKETRNQLDNLAKKADILNDRLARKNMIWFLAGAGVLLVGFLMGSSSRKKKGSYY